MAYTVRDFAFQVYRLINASNPTVPLHGDDEKLCILVLNQLIQYYASDGQMLTIAKTLNVGTTLGVKQVAFVDPSYPTVSTQSELVALTTGSPNFDVVHGLLYSIGDGVTGIGIPANTVITNIDGNTVTINNNATVTGVETVTFTHDITDPSIVYIKKGRMANLDSAWLELSGVTYPLIIKSRDEFLAAWKYEPLQGLPRFAITYPDTDVVFVQLYPAPSQFFEFFVRGKFQIYELDANDDMSVVPQYYRRFLLFATAKDVALYKGRADAWTEKLEMQYQEAYNKMVAASEVNLTVCGDEESLLNGAWRVRAGI